MGQNCQIVMGQNCHINMGQNCQINMGQKFQINKGQKSHFNFGYFSSKLSKIPENIFVWFPSCEPWVFNVLARL